MRLKAAASFWALVLLASSAWGTTTYTVVYSFTGSANDGATPWDIGGALVRDASGNMFGTTQAGGFKTCQGVNYQTGTVFELSGTAETDLYNFTGCSGEGISPTGSVAIDASGNIFGTTQNGGSGDCGLVWELSGSTFNDLHDFDCSSGAYPFSGVILDANGNIYGTAALGSYGAVWEISSGAYNILYTFTGGADGANPYGGLVMDAQGNLYGTTALGGANGQGTVFKLSNSGGVWTEAVLHSFSNQSPTDGQQPYFASLTLAGNPLGNVIYGVTEYGGSGGNGTAFKMSKTNKGYKFSLIHSFTRTGGDGGSPFGTLLLRGGTLYGTTEVGGSSDSGTVFKLALKNAVWTETILHNFTNGADGSDPIAGLTADSKGNLYGLARDGGTVNSNCSQGCGVIFKIKP
jgi:uncharacterized repeat protein (TIGR03803 family)